MRKTTKNQRQFKSILGRCLTLLLTLAMLLEVMSFGIAGLFTEMGWMTESGSSGQGSTGDNSVSFDKDAVSEALRGDIIKSLKKDLIQRVEQYELSGPVGLILTFSENSLVTEYDEKYSALMSYDEFKASDEAKALERELEAGRASALRELTDKGLVYEVKYTYSHILDGAFVSTTYENLADICEVEGISRITVSDTYLPMEAVSNPVDVYDTGIFNSGSVEYTGKGTIVAVLDTGCDYAHSAFTTHVVSAPRYDRDDIAKKLPNTVASTLTPGLEAREVYYGNLTGGKIAFGYDYADKDADIMPFDNSHGTHVAGIIAGKDDTITGVAVDAQLAIMKVFSDYDEGAEDGDIIAALEDCIILGVDAINMSLGASCGFSYEHQNDLENAYKNTLYDNIDKAGISLIVAASNDFSSGFGGEDGNTNKTDNPDSATVGSPASYPASFTVASVSGKKENYMLANGTDVVFFTQSFSTSAEEYDFFEMMGIKKGEKKVYEYVTIPGLGLAINYAGLDVKGKIALVQRGDITFEEKVQFAQEAGAIAVIIYNNVYGDITMTIGNHAKIPAVSIGRDEGEMLAAKETGTFEFNLENVAGPFMSDFSSWGPTPDLKLKPEITAHGGNIYSAVVGGEYDEQSGTSMAAPNMCGITVLIRQYVNEKYPQISATDARDLVNRLCMSTATIALDKKGNPYSPRKQGAGLADIRKATTTAAYLLVDGIGKTKLELGDDPARTGVYEMTVKLVNISGTAQSYVLGNITMTESVSTSDPEYVAEIAYILSNTSEYSVEGGTLNGNTVTVEANQTATVTVKITLSDADKSYIDSTFENGMYVEGFLTFDNTDENGVDLNAPFLAFYGNWGDAPIFDLDYYEVETEAHNNAIDDDDKIKADYYPTTPLGLYYYDYIIPLGSYVYEMDESEYTPIPATREHAAVSYYKNSISGIYGVLTGLLRGAKEMSITIVNTDTGEVVWEMTEYNCTKAHYRGGMAYGYMSKFDLEMVNTETNALFGNNNEHFEVTMSAKLDWEGGENLSDTYSFSFYIDYEAPTVTDSSFWSEYDKSREEYRYYLDVMVYDNHYAMSCRPVLVYEVMEHGKQKRTFSSLTENPIPVYQQNKGEATKVTIEITDYIDIIKRSATPNGITLYVDDYAMNSGIYYIPFPETDNEDMEFKQSSIDLDINQTFDLNTFFVNKDGTPVEKVDYLQTLQWSSTDESVVIIKDGKIEAVGSGTAKVRVTSDSWLDYTYLGTNADNNPSYSTTSKYKEITVNVSTNVKTDDPNSGKNVQIEDLFFSSYDTLFAFTNDIDFSDIGITGTTNYFDGNYSIEFYPSEKIKLNYELKPWNLSSDRYELSWSTSNPKVATVDENGVVTAQAEGKARITLQIKIDGKTSLLAARLSVEVKSEFIIENRELIAYKGWGGDVVIPDDEGILYIGAFAFSHFILDNEKVVPKDENGYYDFDLKKTPIGNDTITSVVVPEGVETIKKYAFYNCSVLESVTLPESCEQIANSAFEKCAKLVDVNFDDVKIIADYAFYNCTSLSCKNLGGVASEDIYAIGKYAFAKTAVESLSLLGLSKIGARAFSDCKSLTTVVLGERTRVSESMFEGSAIESIVVHSDTIGDRAFANCKALSSVTLTGDVTYLGGMAFIGCDALESFTAEGQIEQIGHKAFSGCSLIKEITLPDGNVFIDNEAFYDSGIEKIIFSPNTLIDRLGSNVFPKNSFEIDVTDSINYYKGEDGAVYNASGDTLVVMLPSSIVEFTVPRSVKYISSGAFTALKNLRTVSFEPGSELKRIGAYAFSGCYNLTTVNLPAENKIALENHVFYEAYALRTIDFSGITELGEYAFYGTSVSTVNLTQDNVVIGKDSFMNLRTLNTVTLGKGAVVSEGAFRNSTVVTVDLVGDATIGENSFMDCYLLESFDFAELTGTIAKRAFYGCKKLTTVNAPYITAIGEESFANCEMLSSFKADELITIGDGAFCDPKNNINTSTQTDSISAVTRLSEIDLPKVETIGNYSFMLSLGITRANLPSLKSMGERCFSHCVYLSSITLSEEFKEIPHQAFYYCLSLTGFDFTHIEKVGSLAFSGVPLPANLELPNVVRLEAMAFAEPDFGSMTVHTIESVTAPKLTYVGDEAFALCTKLKKFDAPLVEYIGNYAFSSTAFVSFEITEGINGIGENPFINCERLEDFYATVNGERVFDKEFDSAMVANGVLYLRNARGYSLVCYPMAKRDKAFTVAEGTTRIEFQAVLNNKHIEAVVLPSTLRTIGDFAFYGCDNLNTVTFKSYYAPTLVGYMTVAIGEENFVTVDNVVDFPGFEDLYKYDYDYMVDGWMFRNIYNTNFKAGVGTKGAVKMTAIIPESSYGYDSLVYNAYFNVSDTQSSGISAGKYAIAFMDAVYNLPESADRFDRLTVEAAINAYNALAAHTEEMSFVDAATVAKFERIRSEYNVDVVDGMIAHLFGMYNNEYCFNQLRDATLAYQALTDEEKAAVASPSTLGTKLTELEAAMGVEVDFTITYAEHFPEDVPPTDEPPVDDDNGSLLVIIIIAASLVVLGGAVAVFFILKKKKSAGVVNDAPVADEADISDSDNDANESDADAEE